MNKKIVFLFLYLFPVLVFAAASGGHADAGHGLTPQILKTMVFQFLNVSILFTGIYFLVRKKMSAYFKKRKDDYLSFSEKAAQQRNQAQKELDDIENKIRLLVDTQEASLLRAQAEAADLKNRILKDAFELAKKLKEDSLASGRMEADRAKGMLRDELIKSAVESARKHFKAQVSQEDHQKLQVDFISNIGALQR